MRPNLPPFHRAGQQSFALIATLALLAVATILLVLFVSTTTLDRSASYSYSQSMKADQIGQGGLHLVVGQLQAEMYKDAPPDTGGGTYPNTPIFTNVTSANILPQATVTNTFLPALIKMSTNAPFFVSASGTANSTFQSTTYSSTTPSLNYRSVSTNVWNQIYMGQYPNTAATPYWVIMTRAGATNAAGLTFGTTGATLNNPSLTGNPNNYAVGRFAYAVYDESGLLDINAAGYDPNLLTSAGQVAPIKGTLAGADLTQVGISDPHTFVQWRNSTTAASASAYLSYVTNFASTNAYPQVAPGDSTFVSRQDLIKAAQSGTGGLTTTILTNLTTFTREVNAPSWAPSLTNAPVSTTFYSYVASALKPTASPYNATTTSTKRPNPNTFVPLVRYTHSNTVTSYRSDGTSYTYAVNAGDPVVQQRFPLDRLSWIGPNGPNTVAFNSSLTAAQQAAAICACFGLVWGTAENVGADSDYTTDGTTSGTGLPVWKYYGSSLSPVATKESSATLIDPIESLTDISVEATPRAPNFFELVHTGVLSGSLGIIFGSANGFGNLPVSTQNNTPLQLFRIGANILSQVQSQGYPINIEYNSGGSSTVAMGVANLPYINALKFVGGTSPDDPDQSNPSTTGSHKMGIYGLIGLWNPHQRSAANLTRPNVRLYVQGELSGVTGWGVTTQTQVVTGGWGNNTIITPAGARWIQLNNTSSSGSGGFQNPYGITSSDFAGADATAGTTTTAGWAATPASMTTTGDIDSGVTYEAFRLPDISVNYNISGTAIPGAGASNPSHVPNDPSYGLSKMSVYLGGPTATTASANPFQMILKYQDASGNWVPYDYFDGVNNTETWFNQQSLSSTQMPLNTSGNGASSTVASPYPMPTLQATLHPTSSSIHGGAYLIADPRCLKFGPFPMISDAPAVGNSNAGYGLVNDVLVDSIWSGYNTLHSTPPLKVLSPFDVSGYGGNGSGAQATPGLPPNGELNAVYGFMANYFFPAYLPRNNTAYPNAAGTGPGSYFTAYLDTDGIQRLGDSGLFPTVAGTTFAGATGNPYYDPNDQPNVASPRTSDRPIVLNRPFNSIGELGYAFRDDPFRSIDFFSVNPNGVCTSGDSGLLDLFTVTDSVNPVVAGRVNLNTKNPLVLQAVLNNTLADPVGGSQAISSTALAAIPSLLTTFTQGTSSIPAIPLVNKDQLVTKFNPTLTSSAFGSTDEQNVKAYRESSIRALSDVGQTRTWNLLIDLVAQSGKYPPTATSLDQFEVEGERHYWLHVAIDRFTGKIVDRQLEVIAP